MAGKRKHETLDMDGKTVTIHELKISQILDLMKDDDESINPAILLQNKTKLLEYAFTGITEEEIMDMAPSQVKGLWERFKDVNSDFFALVRSLKLDRLLTEIIEKIRAGFMAKYGAALSSSLQTATPTPGNTEEASSTWHLRM